MDTRLNGAVPPGLELRLDADSSIRTNSTDSRENSQCASAPSHTSARECSSSWPSSWIRQASLKLFKFYIFGKHSAKRLFIIFWYELSMDPRVRLSPWSPPVKNEVKLSWDEVFLTRQRRIFFIFNHCVSLLGIYYCLTGQVKIATVIWAALLGSLSLIAVTAGAHRLWSHRAYKARWPLRLTMAVFQTVAVQYSVLNWVRDHRVHHKFVDTDADPHNSRRGFFFSHIGWVLVLPHPAVQEKKSRIDTRDVESDWVVSAQYKYYLPLSVLLGYIVPTLVPWYFWSEGLWTSHIVAAQLRHVLTSHGTFLINSAAHMWGTRPYDKNINPTENMLVSVASMGEGWHNYHHTFPWDYKNAELWDYKVNLATAWVDLFAWLGQVYERKTVNPEMVAKRARRTGDGTHPHHHHGPGVWGWNDDDVPQEDRAITRIIDNKAA
nr:PREDICTED: acyl-CoA Delta(11) desaturase-like [Bemisia tabaci]